MAVIITVAGTDGYKGDNSLQWWQSASPWSQYMHEHGCENYTCDEENFVWTTHLNTGWRRMFGLKDHHIDWQSGGIGLKQFLRDVPFEDRNVIAHSHGGQVALYAASRGCKIRRLMTVGTPVRKDMEPVIKLAKPFIQSWTHVHSDWTDLWQIAGELFDGHLGVVRDMPFADQNTVIPNVGHSRILYQPPYFHFWEDAGLLKFFTNNPGVALNPASVV